MLTESETARNVAPMKRQPSKSVTIPPELVEQAESRFAPKFGKLNWNAFLFGLVLAEIERDQEADETRVKTQAGDAK